MEIIKKQSLTTLNHLKNIHKSHEKDQGRDRWLLKNRDKVKVQDEQGGQKRKATISFEFEDALGLEAIIEGILDSNKVR